MNNTLGYFRPNTQVDDYAYFHLLYPEGMQVFITTSMLVSEPQRADVQEKQLLEGMIPSNPLFGIEEPSKQGVLTSITTEGIKKQEPIISKKSSYMHVFDDVYNTIREGKPYPVTA